VLGDFLADVIRAIAVQLGAGWVLLFLHDPRSARESIAVTCSLDQIEETEETL
jgi:hypothetical protein